MESDEEHQIALVSIDILFRCWTIRGADWIVPKNGNFRAAMQTARTAQQIAGNPERKLKVEPRRIRVPLRQADPAQPDHCASQKPCSGQSVQPDSTESHAMDAFLAASGSDFVHPLVLLEQERKPSPREEKISALFSIFSSFETCTSKC